MLKDIELGADASSSDCATALAAAWPHGRVFHLRGVRPVDDLRAFYGAMIDAVGEASRLAESATIADRSKQRTSEVWMEVRYDPSIPDAYRHSSNAQPLHTDGSYISTFPNAGFLACVSQSADGGETTFLDGEVLVDILQRSEPAMFRALCDVAMPHARSGDRRVEPVLRLQDGEWLLNWNYYCVDDDVETGLKDLRERFFSFLGECPEVASSVITVKLEPGEAVIWKDDRVLHGRNRFAPHEVSERFFWKAAIDVRPEKVEGVRA